MLKHFFVKPVVLGSKGSSLSELLEGLLIHQGSCTHCPCQCMPWNTFSLHHFCFITSPVYKHPWCYFPSHDPREGFLWAKTDPFLGVCCGGAPDFGLLTLARSPFCSLGCPVRCTFMKCCRRKARIIFLNQTKVSGGSLGSPQPSCTHSTAARKQNSQATTESHCQGGGRGYQEASVPPSGGLFASMWHIFEGMVGISLHQPPARAAFTKSTYTPSDSLAVLPNGRGKQSSLRPSLPQGRAGTRGNREQLRSQDFPPSQTLRFTPPASVRGLSPPCPGPGRWDLPAVIPHGATAGSCPAFGSIRAPACNIYFFT